MATTGNEKGTTSDQGIVGASDVIGQVNRHWNVSGTAVLAAWGVAMFASLLIVLLYSWIRWSTNSSSFEMIYESRIKYCKALAANSKNEDGIFVPTVPERNPGFLSWLTPALVDYWIELKGWMPGGKSVRERNERMLQDLGLDATLFLRCLAMLRWLFLSITLLVGIPALYANYQINTAFAQSASGKSNMIGQDKALNTTDLDLLLFTAANASGNTMSAHVIFECVTTCLVVLFVWMHMSEHRELLKVWYRMNANEVSFKTIMLTDLGIERTIKSSSVARNPQYHMLGWWQPSKASANVAKTLYEAKVELCRKLEKHGCPSYASGKVEVELTHQNMKSIAELIRRYRKEAFKHFDHAMTVWLRQGTLGDSAHSQGCWDRLIYPALSESDRDTRLKDGVKSAIDECVELRSEITEAQAQARNNVPESYNREKRHKVEKSTYLKTDVNTAFITMRSIRSAQDVVKRARRPAKDETRVDAQLAPRSDNILWENYDLEKSEQSTKALTAKLALIFVCFLNTIPLLIITFLTNLDSAIEKVPAFRSLAESSDFWKGVFTIGAGLAPATVAAIFSYFLPYIMRFLSQWSGALTKGQLDRDVISQLFFFLVFWQFMVFSLITILYEAYLTVKDQLGPEDWVTIYDSLGDVPDKITQVYISNSTYWLSWYPIRTLVAWITLLQIPRTLIKFWQVWIKHLFVTYEQSYKDILDIAQPEPFEYAINLSHILFSVCVGLAYAPLAPLVPICCTVYLWIRSVTCLNQLTFVEKIEESDGASWQVVMNRILAALSIMIILTGLVITLKTRSAPLSVTAFVPLVGPAYLAHLLRTNSKPEDMGDLHTSESGDSDSHDGKEREASRSVFRHGLLDPFWEPEFFYRKPEEDQFQLAKNAFPGLRQLILTPAFLRRQGISDATKRGRRGEKGGKRSRGKRNDGRGER